MEKNNKEWPLSGSTENAGEQTAGAEEEEEEEVEDDDETLSLSALPLIHQWRKDRENEEESTNNRANSDKEKQTQDQDFDFCSLSKNSKMCAADEVFFRGQILPLRDSVSSEKGLLSSSSSSSPQYGKARSIPRSESMDRFYPGPGGLVSSRSSSISSHQSTSSSSGGSSVGRTKLMPARNQFHSHPSPSPKLRFPSKRNTANQRNSSAGRSSAWSVLRLGILTARPDIAFQDLKPRAQSRDFGSRNSTDSNGSSVASGGSRKKNRGLLLGGGGCRCSADAVDTVIKRSASEGEAAAMMKPEKMMTTRMKKRAAAKKHLSHHRTFEWLRQLSLEDEDGDEA